MEFQEHVDKKLKNDEENASASLSDVISDEEPWQTNSLIWCHLSSYLSLSDLKTLRLACVNFNHQIVHETKLSSRTTVNLMKGLVKPNVFGAENYLWKNFIIPYGKYYLEYEWICPSLKSAESLAIIATSLTDQSYPVLERLLDEPNNLKSLKLSIEILGAVETSIALRKLLPQAKMNLENLAELHLSSPNVLIDVRLPPYENMFVSSTGLLLPLLKNLQVITIESMASGQCDSEVGDISWHAEDGWINKLNQNLIGIILENMDTIVQLHLKDFHLWTKSPVHNSLKSVLDQNATFPRLQSLRMLAHRSQKHYLIDFLKRQPYLEQLDVALYSKFPNDVLTTIRERSEKLKILRITTKGFEIVETGMWNFLSGLTFLEEFQLHFTKSMTFTENGEYNLIKTIFANFPGSIKKIHVKSHACTNFLEENDFIKINPDILTHLTVRVPLSVNDATMKFICRNFKRLQHLDLRGSTKLCTDLGFTSARRSHEPKFSLSALQGLKFLSLDFGKLTDVTLASGIRFRELKYLFLNFPDPKENRYITSHAIRGLVKGNPSLELLKTFGSRKISGFPTLGEMKKLNPRIEHIEIEGSPRMKDELDAYESDHIQSDSEMTDLESSFDMSLTSDVSDSTNPPTSSPHDDHSQNDEGSDYALEDSEMSELESSFNISLSDFSDYTLSPISSQNEEPEP